MTGGSFGVPATAKTELPMTISNCLPPINIFTRRSIQDPAETLNSDQVIPMQNGSTIMLLDSGQHPEKVFPTLPVCIIGKGCEVSCILIFMVSFYT